MTHTPLIHIGHMYRLTETFDFPQRLHSYLGTTGFRADKAESVLAQPVPVSATVAV
jgi:hypothetical protein